MTKSWKLWLQGSFIILILYTITLFLFLSFKFLCNLYEPKIAFLSLTFPMENFHTTYQANEYSWTHWMRFILSSTHKGGAACNIHCPLSRLTLSVHFTQQVRMNQWEESSHPNGWSPTKQNPIIATTLSRLWIWSSVPAHFCMLSDVINWSSLKSNYQYNGVYWSHTELWITKAPCTKAYLYICDRPNTPETPHQAPVPWGTIDHWKGGRCLASSSKSRYISYKIFSVLFVWSNITTKHDLT